MSTEIRQTKTNYTEVHSSRRNFSLLQSKASRALAATTAATLAVSGSILLGAVPAQAAPGYSQANAQYLSGSLLGTSLANVANVEGVQAQVPATGTATDTEANNLNISVLGDTLVLQAPNGVQIPLNIADVGVLGQYAQATPTGNATAATGAVGSNGTVGVNPDGTNPPGPLTLDLSDVLGADVTDSIANLTVTAGASTSSATQTQPAAPTGDYQIAGTTVTLTSPVVAGLSDDINAAAGPLQDTVDAVAGPDGSLLTSLTGLLGATGVVSESNASIDVDIPGTVATVLGENQVLGGEGPVTVNLANGNITVDIAALLAANGQDLNDLPANTELLSTEVLNLVTDEVDELVTALLTQVDDAVTEALNAATVDLDLVVDNPLVPNADLLNVSLTGTLEDIANGTTTATVTAGPAATVNATVQGLISPLLDLNVDTEALLAPVRALYPTIADVLTSVASLQANVQETSEDGVFTETALRLRLLQTPDADGNALQLNLAAASVGPNAADAVIPPTVTSFTPTSGPEAGGTVVTITGSGFTGATDVTFGDTPAADFTVNSDTQITATTPAGTGTVPVTITTADGEGTSPGDFTYIPANSPTAILDFTPISGPEAGGTVVTITGSGFTGTTDVTFGGTSATDFTVNSDTEITATTPAGTGAVPVTVTPAAGEPVVSTENFTYVPDDTTTIVSFTPTSGPEAGGTPVTIVGSGFIGATGVTFGGNPGTDFTVNSDTEITVTTPAGTGAVPVTVTGTPDGNVTAVDLFTYVPADTTVITGFTPTSGPEAGGTPVTIVGSGFTGADGVTFGNTPATNVTVVSDTEITATSPAGTGSVPITVVGTENGDAVSDGLFTYIPADTATVTGFTPTSGPEAGGTVVTITGSGFTGADGVLFGNTPATAVAVLSDNTVIATTPAGTGAVPITVTGGENGNAVSDGLFTYIPAATTTILGFTPTSGPEAGGTVVTITGSGFTGATGVTFGGNPATNFSVVSDTAITATTPAGTGTVPVTVVGGTSGNVTANTGFTYVPADTASVTGFTPTSGPEAGGTVVTITGSGFTGATGVTFGGNPATAVAVLSSTTIIATTPAGTGVVPVTIVGTDSGNVTAPSGFTYLPADETVITGFTPTSGPEAGGTVVTITGSGFTGATGVTFGTTPATTFTVASDTTIIATSPAGTGAVSITVTGTDNGNATSDEVFTYVADANTTTVAGFTPTSGPTAGGTTVIITGTNLSGTDDVLFGDTPAQSVVVNSDTQITVVTPPGTAGSVPVTLVSNEDGNTTAEGEFTYVTPSTNGDAPTITGVTPNKGTTAGGTTVIITGTGFTGATGVTFDGKPATGVVVNSDTQITATTPAGTAGTVDVVVLGPNGNGTAEDGYTYVDPNANTNPNNGDGGGSGGGTGDNGNGTTPILGTSNPPAFTDGVTNRNGTGNNGTGKGNLAYTGADNEGALIWTGLLLLSGAGLLVGRRFLKFNR